MSTQENPSNNYQAEHLVIPQQYLDEARQFLANAEDNDLVEIIAESFYRDDVGGAA